MTDGYASPCGSSTARPAGQTRIGGLARQRDPGGFIESLQRTSAITKLRRVSLLRPRALHASIKQFIRSIRQRAWWERRMSRWIVGIIMSVIVFPSDALSQNSLQGLERSTQFDKALRAVDAIKHRKRLQCVISTANAPICRCLAEKLPVDTYVRSYLSIVNGDKNGQDYGQLSVADKAIVDRCLADGR
jgi:phosphoserine phosphatase